MQERRSHCASFVRFDRKTRRGVIDNFSRALTPYAPTGSVISRAVLRADEAGPPTRSCNLTQNRST